MKYEECIKIVAKELGVSTSRVEEVVSKHIKKSPGSSPSSSFRASGDYAQSFKNFMKNEVMPKIDDSDIESDEKEILMKFFDDQRPIKQTDSITNKFISMINAMNYGVKKENLFKTAITEESFDILIYLSDKYESWMNKMIRENMNEPFIKEFFHSDDYEAIYIAKDKLGMKYASWLNYHLSV